MITGLAVQGCSNKKNVSDSMTDKETTAALVQQEIVQLSTQETTAGQTTDSNDRQEEAEDVVTEEASEEVTEEAKEVVVDEAVEETALEQAATDIEYTEQYFENAEQEAAVETDNNSFAAGYAAASQYSQLVIVQSYGTRATVTMHELQDGVWTEILRTDGFVGSRGVGHTREGLSTTPQGTFPLYFAFGINPNPGTQISYHQADEYDWWVGDSSSPLYNQYVRTDGSETEWSKENSEHIIDYPDSYGYCLFIGYNAEGTPNMGSCFFLHCSNGRPTAGCVSVPESDMVFILRHIGGNCGIVIE